jgi:DNA-binding GntR family transcriptional regulator
MISRSQLSDDVADYVRQLIVSGQAKPGSRVRPEAIASQLGVSSTPAREALQALRAEGFLQLEAGRGFAVAPLVGDDIRDVFTAQSLLAGELVARAALRVQPADLERLESIQHDIENATTGDETESLNHQFHRSVNLLAEAPKIAAILRILNNYVPHRFYSSVEGWRNATLHDHKAILAAMRARDSEAARAAMAVHVVNAGELLARHFDARVLDEDAAQTKVAHSH